MNSLIGDLICIGIAFALVCGPALVARIWMPNAWAVARQMISEALRMKVALVFILMMLLGFYAAATTVGDGTVSGRVQAFLTYSLITVSVLLGVLTIFLARSLSDELVNRQIFMLMSKPIARWQFLVGKWLGVVLLDAMLMLVSGIGIYFTVQYIASRPKLNELDAEKLKYEVLVARHSQPFEVPNFSAEVEAMYSERVESGAYDDVQNIDPAKEKERLRSWIEGRWRAVPVFQYRVFEFRNVLCERDPNKRIQVRYKAEANRFPPDEILRTVWLAGTPEQTIGPPQARRDVAGRYHSIPFPADVIGKDRTLQVTFVNQNPFVGQIPGEMQFDNRVMFEGRRGVEVLFEVGTFGGNLIRTMLLIQCKLMFLAAIAFMFASVFSFPVATLCSFCLYLLASTREFVGEAISFLDAEGVTGLYRSIVPMLLQGLYLLIPNFAHYDGTELLADGRNVTLLWVLDALIKVVGVGTMGALLLACLMFRRRQVAMVSV